MTRAELHTQLADLNQKRVAINEQITREWDSLPAAEQIRLHEQRAQWSRDAQMLEKQIAATPAEEPHPELPLP